MTYLKHVEINKKCISKVNIF